MRGGGHVSVAATLTMNPEEEIFEAAAALPPAERSAYLDAACTGQPELRGRIESLLRSHDVAGFMEESVTEPGFPDLSGERAPFQPEQSGAMIGRYKLLQQIGEGGFGVVWMAEQLEPVTRRVALKIIKAGMDTKEVIGRFEAERQALAMMDHPNIAKVHDAGATDKGRPYFVMELVKGITITKFCDEQEFTSRQRLELFADVCSAINHAHQKGVIHRDIKPSNVMVTLNGGRPVVKVIDFGIAKATRGRLTDKTLFTRFEQFIGTPAYMSPEQAAISELDIDTRSDIYALGILLYELLTGKPPFDSRTLVSAGYEEMRRIIREVEPAKPSSRLSNVAGDERTSLAKARHITPEKLRRMVEPDLDWIVMKAIEKDRTRRYATANGLALDIHRFLADEPVSAGPPSAAYRFRKFARRNKMALRLTAAVAAVLVSATTVSVWQAFRATGAERLATAKTSDEKTAREDAEQVSEFLTEVFESPDPARDGRTVAVVEILDRAARKLETGLAGQPARRAKFEGALGRTYHALGLYDEAIILHKNALDFRIGSHGKEQEDTLCAMRDLANSCDGKSRFAEALALREEVVANRLKLNGPAHRETLRAKQMLAASYQSHFRLADALRLRMEVLGLSERAFGPGDPDSLRAMNALALSYHATYRAPEAIGLLRKALDLSVSVNTASHPDTLAMMRTLANLLHDYGAPAEAARLRREEFNYRKDVNGLNHSDTLRCRSELAESVYNVDGNSEEAIRMLTDLVDDYRKTLTSKHRDTLLAIAKLAEFYVSSGRPAEAKSWIRTLAASPAGGSMVTLKLPTLEAWLSP